MRRRRRKAELMSARAQARPACHLGSRIRYPVPEAQCESRRTSEAEMEKKMSRSLLSLRVTVKDGERALLLRDGRYDRVLTPGRYDLVDPLRKLTVERYD